jgi:AraC family transcriptional regulator of adaptative response/methylated-DNA-[protein]-cysteine methyltransferase
MEDGMSTLAAAATVVREREDARRMEGVGQARPQDVSAITLDVDAAWAAVLARDAQFDGRFVYAVSTTGVYCRPICPSRRPRRENVLFFPAPGTAEAAGFRPCLRCHPRNGEPTTTSAAVERARAHLEANLDSPVTLAELAREVGLSPYHLQRTFKRLTGVSPKEYAAARRAGRLKARLRGGDTVSRATYEAGYGSSSRVYEQSDTHLGMTPATYRRGGLGAHIRSAVVGTSFGRLLVAATERGVCAVMLGDDDESLEAALAEEYPNATVERSPAEIGEWVEAIVRHLEGVEPRLDVPVDVRGTAFQWRVWKALQEIPYGSTRSYREVAAAIGAPSAVRAVAGACARNRVALVVPCHRVLRDDGALSGYRWGRERKRRLLEQERALAPRPADATDGAS